MRRRRTGDPFSPRRSCSFSATIGVRSGHRTFTSPRRGKVGRVIGFRLDRRIPRLSLRLQCVPLALPVPCVLTCSDTGRASGTQRLDSDRPSIHTESWFASGWGLSVELRIDHGVKRIALSRPDSPKGRVWMFASQPRDDTNNCTTTKGKTR
jgi:hypothetical protein